MLAGKIPLSIKLPSRSLLLPGGEDGKVFFGLNHGIAVQVAYDQGCPHSRCRRLNRIERACVNKYANAALKGNNANPMEKPACMIPFAGNLIIQLKLAEK